MSSQDLVKQIILKFKSEGSDQVKKAAESISKSMNSRETDRFLKNMEKVNTIFGKTGKDLSSDMKKVTDYFKELNNNQFQKAERNLDRMGRLIKRQIEDLDRLKRNGASADVISARESSLSRTSDAFNRMADNTPIYRPTTTGGKVAEALRGVSGVGGRAGTVLGGMGAAGSVMGIGATIANAVRDYVLTESQNRQKVAGRFKQDAYEVFNGNLEKALLYSDPRRANEINSRTQTANRAGDTSNALATGAGALGAAAGLGTLGTALAGGAALLSAPVVLGAAAVGAGAYGLYKGYQYFKGGGREAQRVENRQSAEDYARSTTFNTEFYNEFAGKADMRYEYQRQLQMGDTAALGFRKQMRTAGVLDEGQMAGLGMQFRRFGTSNAPGMAIKSAQLAKAYGQDVNTTSGLLSQIATVNRGGAKEAAKDLEAMFERAVKSGINDSSLIEEYQKQSSAILEVSKGRMSGDEASATLSKFMMGGATERDLAGAKGAMQAFGQTLSGTSALMSTKKTSGILDLAKGADGKIDMLSYQYLSQLSPEQLATMSESQLQGMGISKEKYDKFIKQQTQGTRRANMGAKESNALIEKAKSGQDLSPFEQEKLAVAYGMTNVPGRTQEEIQGFLKTSLGGEGIDTKNIRFQSRPDGTGFAGSRGMEGESALTPDEIKERNKRNADGTMPGAQRGKQGEGQNKLDDQVTQYMQQNFGAALKIFEQQAQQVQKQLDSNIIGGSVQGISKAADDIAQAMRDAANKIRGGAGLPSETRASGKNAGQGE